MRGRFAGSVWEIFPLPGKSVLFVGLNRDGKPVARFQLGDTFRGDSRAAVDGLRHAGFRLVILSGDQEAIVRSAGAQLGITTLYATKTPEEKLAFIENHSNAVFVGDGDNDAPAMAASFASVAVAGSLESSMKASDAYLMRPGLLPLLELSQLARQTMNVIHTNLTFTLIYNVIGLGLALTGQISALWAAALMPASSLTVTLHSLYRMRRRNSWKS